ncbi:GlsB/YeaQ/YmgE family stress response membrane protein [Pelagibacterium xiamenense]|uniref:GlsB/YeaQ/YmgE family stress response membrane protein n=1 Tax=Pelagibacterium xiamenense TaxID=2901140 RepID=UPI001E40492F|nr:GlsB/YeaQ/YmgE family stress response membrane protein [Pelagibacterium xiamenense]MCD7060986.1 GlsB/YeaQ/YmgE family stress response membrane protein [Pelagibacterium xiamenense]
MFAVTAEPFLIWIAVGLTCGLAGSLIFSAHTVWRYLAAGVAGAGIVGFFITQFGVDVPISNAMTRHIVTAAIGAVSVVFLARVFD